MAARFPPPSLTRPGPFARSGGGSVGAGPAHGRGQHFPSTSRSRKQRLKLTTRIAPKGDNPRGAPGCPAGPAALKERGGRRPPPLPGGTRCPEESRQARTAALSASHSLAPARIHRGRAAQHRAAAPIHAGR